MKKLKISKNVPIPNRGCKYPFADMEVGDSILFDREYANTIRASARYYFQKAGWKLISRSDGDKTRLWRVE